VDSRIRESTRTSGCTVYGTTGRANNRVFFWYGDQLIGSGKQALDQFDNGGLCPADCRLHGEDR